MKNFYSTFTIIVILLMAVGITALSSVTKDQNIEKTKCLNHLEFASEVIGIKNSGITEVQARKLEMLVNPTNVKDDILTAVYYNTNIAQVLLSQCKKGDKK